MSSKTLEELIDGEIEGTNAPEDAQALAHALASDPSVAERLEDHRRAAGAIATAGRHEPPASLLPSVMAKLRSRAGGRQLSLAGRVIRFKAPQIGSPHGGRRDMRGGGTMTSRKVLLGVAAAAVIAIAFFAIKGFPPVGPGAEGTVGAAQRYQSQQIESKDVVLQDAGVQQVLQSDAFRKLIADKEARAVLASKDFQKAMQDAGVQNLIAQLARDQALAAGVANAARDGAFQDAMGRAASDQLYQRAFERALSDKGVQAALGSAAGAASDAGRQAASSAATQAATAQALEKAVNAALDSAARTGALGGALDQAAGAGIAKALDGAAANPAFAQVLQNQAFLAAMKDASFVSLLGNANFAGLVSNPAFGAAMQDKALLQLAGSGALQKAVDAAAGSAAGGARDGAQGADAGLVR